MSGVVTNGCLSCTRSAGDVTKRVPNYSSVTARESLENIRRRQQLEQQQQQQHQEARIRPRQTLNTSRFIDVLDGTYDTIDYDLIKVCLLSQRFVKINLFSA